MKADKLYDEMGKRTNFWKFFRKSSTNYEDMETAMKNYKNYEKELLTRLELAQENEERTAGNKREAEDLKKNVPTA